MKEQKTDPQGIYQEYNDGISYKQGLPQGSLFDVVTQNENFYIGRQWEGVNAPDLDKPVLNLLGRVVSFFIAMIASDSISVSVSPFNVVIDDAMRQVMLILSSQIDQVIEDNDLTGAAKDYIRAAAVDGDAGM
ncbi:MAG: hypothetical protein RR197_05620, partial [Oscillospiraceae bacterium]